MVLIYFIFDLILPTKFHSIDAYLKKSRFYYKIVYSPDLSFL